MRDTMLQLFYDDDADVGTIRSCGDDGQAAVSYRDFVSFACDPTEWDRSQAGRLREVRLTDGALTFIARRDGDHIATRSEGG